MASKTKDQLLDENKLLKEELEKIKIELENQISEHPEDEDLDEVLKNITESSDEELLKELARVKAERDMYEKKYIKLKKQR